jgi:hypothetical protein
MNPSEWLKLLAKCQNGQTTCLRVLEIIERETVSMKTFTKLHTHVLELCYAIERLPANEAQTSLSIQASTIASEMQRLITFNTK